MLLRVLAPHFAEFLLVVVDVWEGDLLETETRLGEVQYLALLYLFLEGGGQLGQAGLRLQAVSEAVGLETGGLLARGRAEVVLCLEALDSGLVLLGRAESCRIRAFDASHFLMGHWGRGLTYRRKRFEPYGRGVSFQSG